MPTRNRLRPAFVLAILILTAPRSSLAAPPYDDDDDGPAVTDVRALDSADHELFREGRERVPIWFSIAVEGAHHSDGIGAIGVMGFVGLPLDRIGRRALRASPAASSAIADDAGPALKPPVKQPAPPPKPPAPEKLPSSASDPTVEIRIPIVVTADVARAAVAAALKKAKLEDSDAKIDSLASRARTSALLPELRLRAVRRVDEGQNLTPTEYDPLHTTSSGGQTVLLEGRATWRLDRLVFADDEVSIERLRQERAEARSKLTQKVLEALFAWQRALAESENPSLSAEEHLNAVLHVIEGEATLDVLTDGWFGKWRNKKPSE